MEKKLMNKPPRDEIWFRKIYMDLIRDHKITTIFRPGVRLCNSNKGFCNGEVLRVKVIDKVGADWADLHGRTLTDFEYQVRVLDTKVCPIKSLTVEDFQGSSPDISDVSSLILSPWCSI
jgi:hypothetical protein